MNQYKRAVVLIELIVNGSLVCFARGQTSQWLTESFETQGESLAIL